MQILEDGEEDLGEGDGVLLTVGCERIVSVGEGGGWVTNIVAITAVVFASPPPSRPPVAAAVVVDLGP